VVFIITGATDSVRDTVGRHFADALGWEFVKAENLRPAGSLDENRYGASQINADPSWRIGALSAAIDIWIYEWRDVVVACPMLTEADRQRLGQISSLVKIVCLEASLVTGRTSTVDQSASVAGSQSQLRWHGSQVRPYALTVDISRQVDEIVAEITGLLMT